MLHLDHFILYIAFLKMVSRHFGPFIQSFCPTSPSTISCNSLFCYWTILNFYSISTVFWLKIGHLLLQLKKNTWYLFIFFPLQHFEKQQDLPNSSTHWKHQMINHSQNGFLSVTSRLRSSPLFLDCELSSGSKPFAAQQKVLGWLWAFRHSGVFQQVV